MQKMRFWEIDLVRGFAVILMIIFNYAFALRYFGIYTLGVSWLFWWLFPRIIAGMFIFIAGLSLAISYAKLKEKNQASRKYLLRGAKIFSLGLMITAATWFFPGTIVFGILHFLGLAIMLSPLFLRLGNNYLLPAAFATIAAGLYLQSFTVNFHWLLWLGFVPENFFTLDYFPILPWLGVALLGICFGGHYIKSRRRFKTAEQIHGSRFVCLLGRKSLLIYLLHQPLLVLILVLLGYKIF